MSSVLALALWLCLDNAYKSDCSDSHKRLGNTVQTCFVQMDGTQAAERVGNVIH